MLHLALAGILAAIVFGAGSFSMLATVGTFLGVLVTSYLTLPVLALDFSGVWWICILGLTLGCALACYAHDDAKKGYVPGVLAGSGVIAYAIAMFFSTAPVFRADAYQRLLGPVETIPFEQAMSRLDTTGRPVADRAVIDQQNVRLVDAVLATRRAQELLGKDSEFGGTYRLGEMELTRREGRLTWAAPLDYTGFFRWLNGEGTPAYVWVDAHDPREAGIVKSVGGRPIRMLCTESAWGQQNLLRSIWNGGYQHVGLEDPKFEIGPDGRPFFVVPTYEHAVGFAGSNPTGVVVFDPQTCTPTWHTLEAAPSWVNRMISSDVAMAQVEDWGSYVRGWLNQSMFGSHADTRQTTPGVELVSTTHNGDTAWYIGLTTAGNRDGTTGFMLVDSRTKRATYFEQAGATEQGARDAILGQVAEKRGWTSTWPILYNIQGRATYLATLKDAAGNFKGVALMPVDDRNLVIVADDLRRALQAYTQALAGRAHGTPGAAPSETEISLDGVVARLSHEVVDGNSVYWLTILERPGNVFTATNRIGPQVALTREGDRIRLRAQGEAGAPLTVLSLENAQATPPR